ncbi:MAG: iron-containing alcohol dehydrogenase, partial [Proteobacteria bacterium]|nr:iron-containing alcohol dehydrogenase [Pseudomonadota bacterium]
MLPEFFEFHNPTKLVYGAGMALDLQPELAPLGVTRFFLVSDAIISGLGIVDKIINGLEEAGMEVCGTYLEVPQDAVLANVIECAEKAKAAGAEAIIAVGGGSVIDAAKGANILISVGGDLMEDYSGAQTLTQRLKPLVVIPTTAGTGSEVTQVAVIYDKENKVKNPFTDKFLLPTLAVLDPELSVSMPPGLTASTGMDALTHAVEAYLGIQNSPTSDYFALGAI